MGTLAVRRANAGGWANPVPKVNITEFGTYGEPNKFFAIKATVASVNTVQTIWVPATGMRVRLMGYSVSTPSAAGAIFRAAGVASVNYQFNTPVLAPNTPWGDNLRAGYLVPSAGQALVIDSSLAGAVFTGTVWGTEE